MQYILLKKKMHIQKNTPNGTVQEKKSRTDVKLLLDGRFKKNLQKFYCQFFFFLLFEHKFYWALYQWKIRLEENSYSDAKKLRGGKRRRKKWTGKLRSKNFHLHFFPLFSAFFFPHQKIYYDRE